MSSGAEWEETTLGAEVDLLTGFPFKSERYTESSDSIPLVRGDNIVQGAMRWDGVKKWPLTERGEYELYELREGDVVLAMAKHYPQVVVAGMPARRAQGEYKVCTGTIYFLCILSSDADASRLLRAPFQFTQPLG